MEVSRVFLEQLSNKKLLKRITLHAGYSTVYRCKKLSPVCMVRYNVYHTNYVLTYTGGESLVLHDVPYETEIKYIHGCHRMLTDTLKH
jgi:hypothetical protein